MATSGTYVGAGVSLELAADLHFVRRRSYPSRRAPKPRLSQATRHGHIILSMPSPLSRLATALAGRYAIEREIGAGGMATVYLAHDVRHKRSVAVKVLRPELAASLGSERFLREIETAAGLHHPHILPLYDSGEADGLLYYVMPFIDGQSLRQRLVHEGELPIPDALRILRDVVDALTEAHTQGLVHRDIKPENVLLRGRHALVTDFGVAKAISEATGRQSLTTAGVALGTPAYMAPEQATADPNLDHRVDIYAVGVLAYELLAGRTPFAGDSPQRILAAHLTEIPGPVSRHRQAVSPELEAVVMRCLAKMPADRWQSAEQLLGQLERLTTPSGGVTPTNTQPLAAERAPDRMRVVVRGAGALGLLLLGAVVWLGVARREAERSKLVTPVQLTANPRENSVTGAAISPDGKYLAFVDARGINLQQLASNERHLVSLDVASTPTRAWWFPDGTQLLVLSAHPGGAVTLSAVSIFGGPVRRLADNVLTAGVSPDGKQIAFIRGLGGTEQSFRELWVSGSSGEGARALARADSGQSFWTLAWSPDSRAVAVGAWGGAAMTIEIVPVVSGARRTLLSDSTLFQDWTGILPFAWCGDGRLVYARRDGPGHQSTSNVWITDTDPALGVTKGEPRRLTQWSAANVRDLSVTANCAHIVALQVRNQADVYVGRLGATGTAFAEVRKLTLDEREDFPSGWSPDGRHLLVTSARMGEYAIYVQDPLGQPDALQLVARIPNEETGAVYAPAGDQLVFAHDSGVSTIPVTGGGARLVVAGRFRNVRCTQGKAGLCVVGKVSGNQYLFLQLDLGTGQLREVARTHHRIPFTNWDLSPDGRRLAVVHNDDNTITVLGVDGGQDRVVAVRGWSNFEFIAWTPDGSGFFINAGSARAESFPALLRVDREGRAYVLRQQPSEWHVHPKPSPNGRFVAFASMSFHGNAWLIQGFR